MTADSHGLGPRRYDIAHLTTVRPTFLLALILALALLVVFATLPGRPLILHVLQKLAHPTVFGVIALSTLVLTRQRHVGHTPVWVGYLIAFLTAVAIGGTTEIAQSYVHRDPALRDVGLDARGAGCALAFAAGFDVRCYASALGRRLRIVLLALAVALAGVILTPLTLTTAGYLNRAQTFPVLFEARTRLDFLFVAVGGAPPTPFSVPLAYAHAPRETALRVPLTGRVYPGVNLEEPSPDWRGFSTLVVEVTNPTKFELHLAIRVHDRTHQQSFDDRFNMAVQLGAGERRRIEIPLETIRTAPNGRTMDMAHIAGVMVFRDSPGGAREFWLNRVELR